MEKIIEGEWIQKRFDYSCLLEYIINFWYLHVLELLGVLIALLKAQKCFYLSQKMLWNT